jgi:hypothetical protein
MKIHSLGQGRYAGLSGVSPEAYPVPEKALSEWGHGFGLFPTAPALVAREIEERVRRGFP